MAKLIPGTRIPCPVRFTVEPGRHIHADGRPFLSIRREGSSSPADIDTLTHKIATMLNAKCGTKTRRRR